MLVRKINDVWTLWSVRNGTLHRLSDGEGVTLSSDIIEAAWSDEELAEFGLKRVVPFQTPDDHVKVGERRFEEHEDGTIHEVFDTEPEPLPTRWKISTYVIVRRVLAAGKGQNANQLLEANPDLKFRFLTVGEVWNDDPPINQVMQALGLDPAVILARPE